MKSAQKIIRELIGVNAPRLAKAERAWSAKKEELEEEFFLDFVVGHELGMPYLAHSPDSPETGQVEWKMFHNVPQREREFYERALLNALPAIRKILADEGVAVQYLPTAFCLLDSDSDGMSIFGGV